LQPWSDEQRNAVLDVASALSSLRGAQDPISRDFIGNFETILFDRGIDPTAF
jgi:hypothetical protein